MALSSRESQDTHSDVLTEKNPSLTFSKVAAWFGVKSKYPRADLKVAAKASAPHAAEATPTAPKCTYPACATGVPRMTGVL